MLLREAAKGHGIDPAPLAMCDLTPLDMHRTAASWAVQSGASRAVVTASLFQADTEVTESHYGHLSDDPVRRVLADNAARLLESARSCASLMKLLDIPVTTRGVGGGLSIKD